MAFESRIIVVILSRAMAIQLKLVFYAVNLT